MNNVEKKLIELTFPTVNIDSIMEVIVATPNARVATEILCGIYIEPVFVKDKLSPSGVARTFAFYDKWNEQVQYSYLNEEIKYAYFPESVDKNTINSENYKSLECSYDEGSTYRFGVKTGVMETRADWCSVREWDKLKDNKFELSEAEMRELNASLL
jgi:hypothetical protein